ncbi:hypothetical protein K1719_001904 [Acacia pycnantha]|nr:hypothetical protein K1719_001904 [Acacia pycnantha]
MTSSPIRHQHSSLPPMHIFSTSASNTDRERSEEQQETLEELENLDQPISSVRRLFLFPPSSYSGSSTERIRGKEFTCSLLHTGLNNEALRGKIYLKKR